MDTDSSDVHTPLHFDTLVLHAGRNRKDEIVEDVPIYASTSFVFKDSAHGAAIFKMESDSFCYSRIGNPTTVAFENAVAALEGGSAALATASGQAAVFLTITTLADTGSNIVIASELSDMTSTLFKTQLLRFGIQARFVPGGDSEEVRNSIDDNTKAIFVESLSLNNLKIPDFEVLADIAHRSGLPLIVDNTAGAGGFLIRPLDHGADIVVESATEWLSISGSNAAGVIVDGGTFRWDQFPKRFPQFTNPLPAFHGVKMWEKFGNTSFVLLVRIASLRDTGPCMNPFEASQLLLGLETLSVRLDRISSNTRTLAEWLATRKEVQSLVYPGLLSHSNQSSLTKYLQNGGGGVISFVLKERMGSLAEAVASLKVVSFSQSIGGSKTRLISRDSGASKKHEGGEVIFVSVGLEHIQDILADFERLLSSL